MSTTIKSNLQILSNEGGLSAYLEQIKKFPMLDAEEEYMLAKNWKTNGNVLLLMELKILMIYLIMRKIIFMPLKILLELKYQVFQQVLSEKIRY